MRQIWLIALIVLLSACASAPSIPETTYHRLPRASDVPTLSQASTLPIVVQRLEADGLHADQALLYALDPSGQRLRGYHYHLWVDPPGYLLQRRLIQRLRAAGAAERITDQLPTRLPALWLSGRIEAFERVPTADGGWQGSVSLRLRLTARDGGLPLIDSDYSAQVVAEDGSLLASVAALSQALDQVVAEFLGELGPALTRAARAP